MTEGYATVLEADALLADELGAVYENWSDIPTGTAISGQYQTGAGLDKLSGTDTLATTELVAGDILSLGDYETATVKTIESDNEVTLEADIEEITTAKKIYKLTAEDAETLASAYSKKSKALTSAYRRLLRSENLTIPNYPTDDEKALIKEAQIHFAAHLYQDPEPNRHVENQRNGIQSETIGDSSVTYGSSANPWPPGVGDLLKSFSKRFRPVKVGRN